MSTIQLQGVGVVDAIPASEVKEGDVRLYNFYGTATVIKVVDKSAKTISIITVNEEGKYYMCDLRKTSLVAIIKSDQDISMHNPKEAYNVSGRNKGMVDVSEYFQVEQTEEEKLEAYHIELQERGIQLTESKPVINLDSTYKVIVSKDRENNVIGEFEKVLTGKELEFQLFMNEVLEIIEEITITEPYFNTDHTIMNVDLWNEEGTEKTNYTLIDFTISRFRISFNNDTKEAESIHLLPVVLHKNPKEYKLNTNDYEAKRALKEAIKIYEEIQPAAKTTDELKQELNDIDNRLNKGVSGEELDELKRYSGELRVQISNSLELLFYNDTISEAQNSRINMLLNEWINNDKYTFVGLYKELNNSDQICLHVTGDTELYIWFDVNGVRVYSNSFIDNIQNKLKLIHDFMYNRNQKIEHGNFEDVEAPEEEENTITEQAVTSGKTLQNDYNSQGSGTLNTFPEIELTLIESYVVPESVSEREHNANWTFRQGKRDNTKELQNCLTEYQIKALEVISSTDNKKVIYDLKRSLEYFKKHYSEAYVKWLSIKGDNVNWAVSGRGNYNFKKAEKLNNRQDAQVHRLMEFQEDMKKRISKAKKQILKEEKQRITSEIESCGLDIQFKMKTKEFTYMNVTEKRKVHCHGEYWIVKTWGAFRVFKGNIELHSCKTTEKLEHAKKFVAYHIQQGHDKKAM